MAAVISAVQLPPLRKATSTPRLNPAFYQQVATRPSVPVTVWHAICCHVVAMEFRIDIESEGPDIVLHVAGRLTGPAIRELSEACEPMNGRFVLDLSKLKIADDAGAEAIRTLRERGADIRGASSFIKLLINGESG